MAMMNHSSGTNATASTRICIKNLPSYYDSEKLRAFLFERLKSAIQVTDCRVLKRADGTSRRMAFVGLREPDMATKCLQQLNKSYCQTCRLVVEYATTKKASTVEQQQQQPDVDGKKALKVNEDKKEHAQSKNLDRSKQDFLQAMGITETTSSRKFWANDDGQEEVNKKTIPKETSDDDSDAVSSDSSDEDDADPVMGITPKQFVTSQSDLDFLRSKQVQVDDLDGQLRQSVAAKAEIADNEEESRDGKSSSSDDEEIPIKPIEDTNNKSNEEPNNVTDMVQEEQATAPNRLFIRNLPFSAAEEHIRAHFSRFGTITECHLPVDDHKRSKGFCFLTFASPAATKEALTLDGTDFQGRLLHILPGRKQISHDENETNMTYKEKLEREKQKDAENKTTGWSASFVRGDAVVDNLAERLGLRKGDILAVKDGLSAGDAAVRLALGETAVIEENRKYFTQHGYDMEALVSGNANPKIPRSKDSILVKNLPHDTTKEEIMKIFASPGETPSRILLPPSRTIAVIEYPHGNDAKKAFRRLAYRRFKSVPLYLEWAPLAAQVEEIPRSSTQEKPIGKYVVTEEEPHETAETVSMGAVPTLYVKNLNFATSEESLRMFFEKEVNDIRAIRIPTKVAATKRKLGSKLVEETKSLSMGFGFVEFGTQASLEKALQRLHGSLLDGHALELMPSAKRNTSVVEVKTNQATSKLVVRNVPFQATRKELLQLFGSFGQLKKVRLPKKFDGSHRGFAFIEYLTPKEASSAMKALSRTHLYGRHLVIEWATGSESNTLTELREKAQQDVDLGGQKSKKARLL